MLETLKNKWFATAAFSLLFITVLVFAYTENYIVLAVPVAFLFYVLLGLNWKAAYFFFLLTIPASIQINFNEDTNSITLPDQPLMWSFLLLFVILMAQNPRRIPIWFWKDKITLVAVLQYIWLAIAVIFSTVLFYSCKYFIAKTWLMVCYFIMPVLVFQSKDDFIRAFKLMMYPMLGTVVVILIHHYTLGFKFDKVQRAMTGLYYNHVDYSAVLSMFFPLLLVAYPLTKGRSLVTRMGLLLVIIIFILGIYYAYARAAYFAVLFAIIIGLAIKMKMVNWVMPAYYAIFIVLLCYLIPNNKYLEFRPDYNNTYMHKSFTDHMIATFRGKDMSSMERLYRWIAAVRMSKDRPITGYGPHGFYYNYKPYAVSSFKTYVSRNPEHSTTHNYFLYMLVEQGWPAMLLYAALIPMLFAKAQKIYYRFKDIFYRSVTLGLAMMLGAGFINNFFSELIETHKVGAFFYIPIALLIVLDHMSKSEKLDQEVINESN